MNLFWIDPQSNILKSYQDLLDDLNARDIVHKYIYQEDPYEIMLQLILALSCGESCHVLDADFSESELEHLGIMSGELSSTFSIGEINFKEFSDVSQALETHRHQNSLVIYTSGTTGRPKKVHHSLHSLARTVKTGPKFENDIWAFAYNITHFAGLQVFLQAFLNRNPMIYIFPLSGEILFKSLVDYETTHISATPTFYKKMLTDLNKPVPSVKRVTLGGEKYDPSLEPSLRRIFPNAVIRNIYASTEAGTLFSSENEIFTIEDHYKESIKISDGGELLVHRDFLGQFEDLKNQPEWFNTGDLVEKLDENHFRFISRKNEMINVGGYKVNPHEVEEMIRKIPGIIDTRISARSNRLTGNILMAEIVKQNTISEELMEKKILDELKDRLQSFKIPRIFRFVDQLSLTRTGKKERL